ncbi:MAG TPA: DUF5683 domain-containing protein [candidate division Zixibacteria bacterium]
MAFLLLWGLFSAVNPGRAWGQKAVAADTIGTVLSDSLMGKKSPTGALLRSVVFPGGGQFYNHKYLKGLVVFGTETTFITLAAIEWSRANTHKKNFQNPNYPYSERLWEFEQYQFYEDRRNLFLWITAGVVFLSMFDAYVDAQLYNFDKEKVRDLPISLMPEFNGGIAMRIVIKIPL